MKIRYSNLVIALLMPLVYVEANEVSLIPPNAKPGECYARVVQPAVYENVKEKVMVKEASEEITIIPAVYGDIEEEIQVVPSTKKLTPIATKFKEVSEDIEIKSKLVTWKTSLKKKALPVSPHILNAVQASGLDVNVAQVGDCFKEYFTPRKFKTSNQEVLIRSEYNESQISNPEFEIIEKSIVVKPAGKEIIDVPAVYEDVEEKVLVEAAKTVWKKGQNPAQKVSGATGEIMCLVKIPAKYKTIKKRVLKSPATTKTVDIPEETKIMKVKKLLSDSKINKILKPALYETLEKTELESEAVFSWHNTKDELDKSLIYSGHQICLTEESSKTKKVTKIAIEEPERIEEEVIAAVNEVVAFKILVEPAKEVKKPIEAEYKMMEKRKKVSDTHIEWQRILCQTNMTKGIIAKLQASLNDKGYTAGEPDGVLGAGTRKALNKFQKDSGLATGGITYETLNTLGITL